jgi:hypothetical protein
MEVGIEGFDSGPGPDGYDPEFDSIHGSAVVGGIDGGSEVCLRQRCVEQKYIWADITSAGWLSVRASGYLQQAIHTYIRQNKPSLIDQAD